MVPRGTITPRLPKGVNMKILVTEAIEHLYLRHTKNSSKLLVVILFMKKSPYIINNFMNIVISHGKKTQKRTSEVRNIP